LRIVQRKSGAAPTDAVRSAVSAYSGGRDTSVIGFDYGEPPQGTRTSPASAGSMLS
jgi:hypothetical protein